MENSISFQQAMQVIDKVNDSGLPIPFDITFRTLQVNSKTGGRLVTYKNVIKSRSKNKASSTASILKAVQSPRATEKNPEHYKNRTRNLELQNGDIKKVKIRQIIKINGKTIHY
jgi:hypothetical protein